MCGSTYSKCVYRLFKEADITMSYSTVITGRVEKFRNMKEFLSCENEDFIPLFCIVGVFAHKYGTR